jgi:hypothetical protein
MCTPQMGSVFVQEAEKTAHISEDEAILDHLMIAPFVTFRVSSASP